MITEDKIKSAKILIVDDEETSIRLLEETLNKDGYKNIVITSDSKETSRLYRYYKPDLLILDLNMPELNGFDVMEDLRQQENNNYLPILIVSNEESREIRNKALEAGARDYLIKPFEPVEVLIRIRNLIEVRLLHNEVKNQNKMLEDSVKLRTQELYNTQLDVIQRLARAIEYRDSETGMHIVRMSHYSAALAAKAGLDMLECEMILTASPLHDIGKIGIPDSILSKPGKLNTEEWEIMKTHTRIGAELLSGSNSRFLRMASQIALTHHERWDGTGYPYGLKGEEIPLIGRICGVADVLDALLSQRPYKHAWVLEDAIAEIKRESGHHFDPHLVEHLLSIIPQIERVQGKYSDKAADST